MSENSTRKQYFHGNHVNSQSVAVRTMGLQSTDTVDQHLEAGTSTNGSLDNVHPVWNTMGVI